MAKKMGRPFTGSEPKDTQIAIRTTDTIARKLAECAEITGRTKTDLLESAIERMYDELTED